MNPDPLRPQDTDADWRIDPYEPEGIDWRFVVAAFVVCIGFWAGLVYVLTGLA